MLNRVRQPFNVNSLAQAAALAALADTDYVDESARLNRDGPRATDARLRRAGPRIRAVARQFRAGAASATRRAVYERLAAQGVIVRPVANYGLPE